MERITHIKVSKYLACQQLGQVLFEGTNSKPMIFEMEIFEYSRPAGFPFTCKIRLFHIHIMESDCLID